MSINTFYDAYERDNEIAPERSQIARVVQNDTVFAVLTGNRELMIFTKLHKFICQHSGIIHVVLAKNKIIVVQLLKELFIVGVLVQEKVFPLLQMNAASVREIEHMKDLVLLKTVSGVYLYCFTGKELVQQNTWHCNDHIEFRLSCNYAILVSSDNLLLNIDVVSKTAISRVSILMECSSDIDYLEIHGQFLIIRQYGCVIRFISIISSNEITLNPNLELTQPLKKNIEIKILSNYIVDVCYIKVQAQIYCYCLHTFSLQSIQQCTSDKHIILLENCSQFPINIIRGNKYPRKSNIIIICIQNCERLKYIALLDQLLRIRDNQLIFDGVYTSYIDVCFSQGSLIIGRYDGTFVEVEIKGKLM